MAARAPTQQVRVATRGREKLERIRREESVAVNRDLTLAEVLEKSIDVADAHRSELRAALAKGVRK